MECMMRWLLLMVCSTLCGAQMVGEGWIGGFRHGAGVQGLAPLVQQESGLLFTQAAGGYFIDSWQGSLGVGYRNVRGFGVNLFGDVSRRHIQLGAGAELFGKCWNVTLNGYLPNRHPRIVGSMQRAGWIYDELEQGYAGADLVGGYSVSMGPGELWGYAGYFYYDAHQVKSVQGPRLRVEYKIPNLCWGIQAHAGVEWQYDRLHKSDTSFIVGVQVPLGRRRCCRPSPMCDLVRRQRGIWVLKEFRKDRRVENPLQLLFVGHNVMGVGTREDPMHINAAVEMATPSHMIMLVEPVELKETLKLKPGQKLGSSILQGGNFDLIELSNNNTIANMELRGGLNAIVGRNITGLSLQNVTIKNAKATALSLDGVDDVKISGLEIHDSPTGIDIKNADGKPIALRNVQVLGTCQNAINFQNNRSEIGINSLQVAGEICNILIKQQSGALNITQGVVNTTNGTLTLNAVKAKSLNFSRLVMQGTTSGITLTGVEGEISFDALTITDSFTPIAISGGKPIINISQAMLHNVPSGIKVVAGSPILSYTGSIDNFANENAAPLLDISQTVGGSITLNGNVSWVAGSVPGINVNMAMIDLNIDGAMIQSSSSPLYTSHTRGKHHFSNLTLEGASVQMDQHFGELTLKNIAVKNSGAGFYLTDLEGSVTITSPSFEKVTGHSVHIKNSGPSTLSPISMTGANTTLDSSSRQPSYRFENLGGGVMNITKLSNNSSNRKAKGSGFFFINNQGSTMGVAPDGTLKGVDNNNHMPVPAMKSGTLAPPTPPK